MYVNYTIFIGPGLGYVSNIVWFINKIFYFQRLCFFFFCFFFLGGGGGVGGFPWSDCSYNHYTSISNYITTK